MEILDRLRRLVKRTPVLYVAWRRLRKLSERAGLRRRGTSRAALRRHAAAARFVDRSYAGEARHLVDLLDRCGIEGGHIVDIAAGDGVTQSCTLPLFRAVAWSGLAVELDPVKALRLEHAYRAFQGVTAARVRVTPLNVEALLRDNGIPDRFEVLNLDLDSWDLPVMEAILRSFRPALVTMEINEKVPPPVHFAVTWDPDHEWREDHFFGCSLTAATGLLRPAGYVLESLQYNNAFFVRSDVAHGVLEDVEDRSAWAAGYRDRPDRRDLFPWNHDVEHLLTLQPDAVVRDLRHRFRRYAGRYDAYVADGDGNRAARPDIRRASIQ